MDRMNTLKRAAELLKSMEWQYRPYSARWNIESGYYCPACGGKEKDGHAEDCELAMTVAELERTEHRQATSTPDHAGCPA